MKEQESTTTAGGKIVQINEARVRDHLAEMVRGSVEEASIRGRVIDDADRPLKEWLAAIIKPGESGSWLRECRTDAEGQFELLDPPAAPIDLELRTPKLWDNGPIVLVQDVHPGDEELVLRVPRDRMPTAIISGRIIYTDVRDGGPAIELVDGEKLADMMEELELGLRRRRREAVPCIPGAGASTRTRSLVKTASEVRHSGRP